MKVYVVTYGAYSEYHIKKVFLDKEKAEKYLALITKSDVFDDYDFDSGRVEEYDTADDEIEIFDDEKGIKLWRIKFNSEGNIEHIEHKEIKYNIYKDLDFENKINIDNWNNCLIVVKADNEATAIKIARDKRSQALAKKYNIAL